MAAGWRLSAPAFVRKPPVGTLPAGFFFLLSLSPSGQGLLCKGSAAPHAPHPERRTLPRCRGNGTRLLRRINFPDTSAPGASPLEAALCPRIEVPPGKGSGKKQFFI